MEKSSSKGECNDSLLTSLLCEFLSLYILGTIRLVPITKAHICMDQGRTLLWMYLNIYKYKIIELDLNLHVLSNSKIKYIRFRFRFKA